MRSLWAGFALLVCIPAAAAGESTTWSAPYLGLFLGYGDANDAWDQGGAAGDLQISPEGVVFGGFAGYTHEMAGLVLGVEADLTFPDFSDAAECTAGVDCAVDVQVLSSLRARAGVAFGPVQVYGAGGLALGFIQAESSAAGGASASDTLSGWTLGGGLEYASPSGVRVGVEYRHSDYGRDNVAFANGALDLETDELRVRLSIPME